ncbi:MAG TPA: peptidoglycan DD-metalloendopeptidase family protein [Candidatus Paceibacterota bacterium]|nr:peptidoglycan DD-metalloendopeptidase family protein [Candidatus Pacearchaeota archaeon]HRZ51376.1 peptidoglycan DD-metalloendopeptidase family protein [Candidatus Paceibacterota bacterium]HSA37098.1 peptidoglycan DD-metalloendopeptidase family protein [Candidatus Paceibacterota bacterium]
MKKTIILISVSAALIFLPLKSYAAATATSTPETPLEIYGQWNGLEAVEILESPYSQTSLKKLIRQLSDDAEKTVKIPVLFGVYRMHLKPNFGEWRGNGRTHEGLDIVVPKGAPIVSPTGAVVLSAGTGASSGKTVSTANPGGETFVYMHLDSIANVKSGDILEPGDLIGFAGNSGNAAGGAAHLHFEIRHNGATDPYPRLLTDFTFKEKISFVSKILEQSNDETALAAFLAANYATELYAAQNSGVALPKKIALALSAGLKNTLSLGARNASVAALQTFLINQGKGPAANALACYGPTGYFGKVTEAALVEYKSFTKISPADGTCVIPKDNDFSVVLAAAARPLLTNSTAPSIDDLKAMIARLKAQISALQEQLARLNSQSKTRIN